MKPTTLAGTREDMFILKGLIEKYFVNRQKEEYIPLEAKFKCVYFLWPVKAFTFHVELNGQHECKTVPFIPVIQDFAENAEDVITELIQSVELKAIAQSN
jgi:hypothetical protein